MTEKRFERVYGDFEVECIDHKQNRGYKFIENGDYDRFVDLLNSLSEENEQLKTRFHEERELAMQLSRECDTLTIKKQELELEIIRLEEIIKTGKR